MGSVPRAVAVAAICAPVRGRCRELGEFRMRNVEWRVGPSIPHSAFYLPHPEPLAARVVAAGGEAQHADEEAVHPLPHGAGDGAVAADGRLELPLEPALELG